MLSGLNTFIRYQWNYLYASFVFHASYHVKSRSYLTVEIACSSRAWKVVGSISGGNIKPSTIKLVFVVSPLSRKHYGKREKIDWI